MNTNTYWGKHTDFNGVLVTFEVDGGEHTTRVRRKHPTSVVYVNGDWHPDIECDLCRNIAKYKVGAMSYCQACAFKAANEGIDRWHLGNRLALDGL